MQIPTDLTPRSQAVDEALRRLCQALRAEQVKGQRMQCNPHVSVMDRVVLANVQDALVKQVQELAQARTWLDVERARVFLAIQLEKLSFEITLKTVRFEADV